MIYRFVKLEFSRRHLPAVKALFDEIAPIVRSFEGCHYLEIFFDMRERGKVITRSHWESEDHLIAYRNSEFFQSFWSKAKPYFDKPAEAWSMKRSIHLP